MTEKRFIRILFDGDFYFGEDYVLPEWSIQDRENPKSVFGNLQFTDGEKRLCDMMIEELNSFADENEQLKQKVDFYKHFQKDARELEKENEELKSELKIYRKIANCGNCEYHNYDWYDDGDEFEVCDKRNDMWYRICEDWREL